MVSGRRCLLYWCLKSLHAAGIRRLVLAGDEDVHHRKARALLHSAHFEFDEVEYFRDDGLGVHGLPVQARTLLADTVLFEAGHGISHPSHYRAMIAHKSAENVVFSAFPPDPANPRYRVRVGADGGCAAPTGTAEDHALAQPMLIDRGYVDLLEKHDFTVDRMARHYLERNQLTAVRSALPVEFDLSTEYHEAMNHYRLGLAEDPLGEQPWAVIRSGRQAARVAAVETDPPRPGLPPRDLPMGVS